MPHKNLILTQCFPPVIGGLENYMSGLAQALAQHRHTVVFADTPAAADDSRQAYALRRFGGLKFLRRRHKALVARALTREDDWRVFCDSWKSLEFFRPPEGVSVTALAHGTEFPLAPAPAKRRRIQSALARAERILANSQATRARMEQCGIDPARVQVWHPPIMPPPRPAASPSPIAAHWQDASPRLLSVSRLARRKGIDIALHAVSRLRSQHPRLRYLIAGSGSEEANLRQQAKDLQLGDSVQFLGAVNEEEKAALYASADIFVLPCRADGNDIEGYGLVFVEAAYYGLPSVAGNSGGATEAVQHGKTGIVCDGDDASAVAAAIQQLAHTPARAKFADNCRKKAQGDLWNARINELL